MAGAKKKIMLVDDDADTREVVSDLLRREGYEVVAVESGQKCLDTIKKVGPDLVLLDVMMPRMTGWETFEQLRTLYEESGWNMYEKIRDTDKVVKVAFLTVVDSPKEKIQELKAMGVADYIVKPFSSKELIQRVHRMLDDTA